MTIRATDRPHHELSTTAPTTYRCQLVSSSSLDTQDSYALHSRKARSSHQLAKRHESVCQNALHAEARSNYCTKFFASLDSHRPFAPNATEVNSHMDELLLVNQQFYLSQTSRYSAAFQMATSQFLGSAPQHAPSEPACCALRNAAMPQSQPPP